MYIWSVAQYLDVKTEYLYSMGKSRLEAFVVIFTLDVVIQGIA